jgi:Stage II sporulation protein E (SpoIIE)
MRKLAALLVIVLAAPMLRGQALAGIVSISSQQCVWHPGDNPAWAAPNLDESGWQPYTEWKLNPDQPHYWVRCHADLSALRGTAHPAVQVSLAAAYQLYANGEEVGAAGNLRSGNFSMNTIRSYPLPERLIGSEPATLAARVAFRYPGMDNFALDARAEVLRIRIGDGQMLDALRAKTILAQTGEYLTNLIAFGILGVLGCVLFGLFLYDRSRRELLLLSMTCVSLAVIKAVFFGLLAMADYSISTEFVLVAVADATITTARAWFFFALARRRMPLLFWILIGLACALDVSHVCAPLLPSGESLRFSILCIEWLVPLYFWGQLVVNTAPFAAFWPYTRIARRSRPLAVLSMVWGAVMLLFTSTFSQFGHFIGMPGLSRWAASAASLQVLVTFCVIVALMGLLFREQRRVTQERAELAGEMQAAQAIQRMLVPNTVQTLPGIQLEVAFQPMREVGGDFYQCHILPDGSQRVLLGDVSGKGAAAAMTATLVIGASKGRQSDSPAALLQHLNRALQESEIAGFVTCVCARIAPDGALTLANAGHLPPYRNGEEIPLPPALPLGVSSDAEYAETSLHLTPGDTLTFLSDGVVEAQSPTGELFGFDRTRAISTQSAENIARAAQAHGQQDDITVLTLTFAPAEVLHA